jgi:polysaccharide pyruvyl transferase WcaK-like protein
MPKHYLKQVLTRTYARYSRLAYSRSGVAVVCPPIPDENLGDQAMVLGAVAELTRRRVGPPTLIKSGPRFEMAGHITDPFVVADRHPFFGSSRAFAEELGLLGDFARSRDVFVFGADVLDGHYGRQRYVRTFAAIERAVGQGARVRVIGFSISGHPDAAALDFFRRYSDQVQLFPRDPVSLGRLQDAGAGNLTLAADVAFLMEAAEMSMLPPEVAEFITSGAGPLIGVSLHAHFFDQDRERLTSLMARTLAELARRDGCRFLCVPHHPKDVGYLEAMESLWPETGNGRPFIVRSMPSAPIAKRMFAACGHVVTSRMHVAIASLSSGVPATCFPYLGKFEGLFEHFQLDEGLIQAERLADPLDLAERIRARIAASAATREQIARRLPDVVRLAQSNFDVA